MFPLNQYLKFVKPWHPYLNQVTLKLHRLIRLVGRVFANGPGDLGSIPGHVITKILKCYLIPSCLTLSNIRYVSRVKWRNQGKGVAPSPTPWCSSYWKGSLLVALDYSHQLYFYIKINRYVIKIASIKLKFF